MTIIGTTTSKPTTEFWNKLPFADCIAKLVSSKIAGKNASITTPVIIMGILYNYYD